MIGHGSKLEVETATPGTFTAVADLDSLSWSGLELETTDDSNFDSPDGGEEVGTGMLKWGEVSVEGNWKGVTSQTDIMTALIAKTKKNFKATFFGAPTGADVLSFSGYFTRFQVTAPLKDKQRFSATIKVAAKPTLG